MLIYFHQVNKHYGDFHVLKDINLTIKKGEVIVIIGRLVLEKVR